MSLYIFTRICYTFFFEITKIKYQVPHCNKIVNVFFFFLTLKMKKNLHSNCKIGIVIL